MRAAAVVGTEPNEPNEKGRYAPTAEFTLPRRLGGPHDEFGQVQAPQWRQCGQQCRLALEVKAP